MARYVIPGTSKSIWGFDPRTVGGCTLWLDGDDQNTMFTDISGNVPANVGQNVSLWKDKSISANNAIRNTLPGQYPMMGANYIVDASTSRGQLKFGYTSVSITGFAGSSYTVTSNVPLSVGQTFVVFAPHIVGSYTLNLVAGTTYYIVAVTGTVPSLSIQLSTSPGGAVRTPTGSVGTGNLPAAMIDGATYRLTATALPLGTADATYFFVGRQFIGAATNGNYVRFPFLSHGAWSDSNGRDFAFFEGNRYSFSTVNTVSINYNANSYRSSVITSSLNNYIYSASINGTPGAISSVNDMQRLTIPLNTSNSLALIGHTIAQPIYNGIALGTLSEMIVFNRALMPCETQMVEGYLAWKWKLQANLPATHPYAPSVSSLSSIVPYNYGTLALWLDASDTATVTLSGSSVTQWNDKSGNGRNVNPTPNAFQYVSAFNGSYPTLSSSITGGGGRIGSLAGFTLPNTSAIFAVIQNRGLNSGTNTFPYIFDLTSGSSRAYGYVYNQPGTGTPGRLRISSGANPSSDSETVLDTITTQVWSMQMGASTTLNYQNGSLITSSSIPGSSLTGPLIIGGNGGGNQWTGHFCEFMIFTTALTTAQRQQVEGYLAYKWGLQGSLPLSHPYAPRVLYSNSAVPSNYASLALWLDAADTKTVAVSGASPSVTSWTDKSGNGRNATTVGSPSYVFSALNGLNGITLSGTSSWATSSSFPLSPTSRISAFVVARGGTRRTDELNELGLLTSSTNFRNLTLYLQYSTPNTRLASFVGGGAGGAQNSSFSNTQNVPNIYELVYDSSTANLYVNGTSYFSGPVTLSGSSLTSSQGLRADCPASNTVTQYEVLFFNTNLSTAQRQEIEGYLAYKWGLQASLPAGHPYAPKVFSLTSISPANYDGLALWLDGADTASMNLSGSIVTQWNDKSGNANHATQTTPSFRPVLQDNGVFFGSTAVLNLESSRGILRNVPYACGFAVANVTQRQSQNSISGNRGNILTILVGISDANTRFTMALDDIDKPNPGVFVRRADGTALSNAVDSRTYTFNSRFLSTSEANYSAGTLRQYLNGNQSVGDVTINGGPGNTSNTDSFAVPVINSYSATARLTNTYLHELILFRSPLSTAQRQEIEGYLAYKWGIQSSLPVGHPYFRAIPNPVNYPFSRNFVPTDLDNCQLWIDPADTSAVTLSGSNVIAVRDKSGNGNNVTNASSTITYTSTLNGLPVLVGPNPGASNSLTSPIVKRDPINHTYFAVVRYAPTSTSNLQFLFYGNEFFGFSGPADNQYYLENNNNITGGGTAYYFLAGTGASGSDVFYGGNTFVCCVVRQGSNHTFTINGNTGGSGGNAVGNLADTQGYQIRLGAQNASIGEVIVYNSALNSADRQTVEGYLLWKWGVRTGQANVYSRPALNLNVPSSHPYFRFPPPALTPLPPTSQSFNRGFTPYDLSPTVWLDPQDSSTYNVDANNRVTTWRNKGSLPAEFILVTAVTSSSIITLSGTSGFAAVGQGILFPGGIGGTPGLVANTTYYIKTITSQTSGNITVSSTVNGPAITTLTNVGGISVGAFVSPVFTIPLTGTGTGISGPLLTSSSVGAGLGQQYLDFSSGGTFNITAASIGATPFTTLTLTTAFAHNIPVGAMIYFACTGGSYVVVSRTVPTGAFTGTGTAVTLTLSSATGLIAGSVVIIAGVTPTALNGTYTLTSVSGSTITFPNTTASASVTVAGTINQPTSTTLASTGAPFLVGPYQIQSAIISGTTTLTITTQIAHNIVPGYPVTLTINTGTFLGGASATSLTGTYIAQTGTTGSTIVLTIGASTTGQMSVIDGHVANNVGTTGYYLTQAGTTASTIVLTSLTPRSTGALTNFIGRVEYGILPFTSAVLTTPTSMTLRTPINHGITGTPAINLNFNELLLPFQSPLPTSGTALNPACLSFTNATVTGGTTLTITVPTNPFFINSGTPNYVGLSSISMTLPTGTLFSNSTTATGLTGTGYITQSGSNTTTLVLTIANSPNGALIFRGNPGMAISTGTSHASLVNSTQTIASSSGNTIVVPIPTLASAISGQLLTYPFPSTQITLLGISGSGLSKNGTYIIYPLNGYALESPSLSGALSTTTSTIVWVSHYSSVNNNPSRNSGGGVGPSPVISAAVSLNGAAGADTTSNGRDFKILNASFGGNAPRLGLIQNSVNKGNFFNFSAFTDAASGFRVNSCVMNFSATASTDAPASTAGVATNGWRHDLAFAHTNFIASVGSQPVTTLAPTHLRIGANTNATAAYTTHPLVGQWYEGGVGDILIFNSILTLEQRQLLEGFLAQKYRSQAFLGATTSTRPISANQTITGGSIAGSNPWTITLNGTFSTFIVGTPVTVAGVTSPATGYNADWTVLTSTTSSLTFSSASNIGAWVSGGTVRGFLQTPTFIHPYRLNPLIPSGPTIYSNSISLWLDAADSSTVSNSGLSTFQWNDKSGNNRNAIYFFRGVSGNMPSNFPTHVANLQNGLAGVQLTNDGSNNQIEIGSFPIYTNRQVSFFVVGKVTAPVDYTLISNGNSYALWSIGINATSSTVGSAIGTSDASRTVLTSPTVNVIGTPFLISLTVSQSSATEGFQSLYINGQNKTTGTGIIPANVFATLMLSRDPTTGTATYHELIGFSNALSDIQRQQVEGYLAWKWGINSFLPTSHAYYKVRP